MPSRKGGTDVKKMHLINGVWISFILKCRTFFCLLIFIIFIYFFSCWGGQLVELGFWSRFSERRIWCCYLFGKFLRSFTRLWGGFEKSKVSGNSNMSWKLKFLILKYNPELPLPTLQAVWNQVAYYWLITGIMILFWKIALHQLKIFITM